MLGGSAYKKINALQRNTVKNILQKYLPLVKWNNHERASVLDVGCGTGDVTTEILLPQISQNIDRLSAVDLDESMIGYAKQNYFHEKVDYFVMDITKEVRPDLKRKFDYVFSIYCLNWIKDYRLALKNINECLKPGGTFLTIILTDSAHLRSHKMMGENPKWSNYLQKYKDYMLHYHDHDNPDVDFRSLLKSTNFKPEVCEVEKVYYKYDSIEKVKEFFSVMHPLILNVPRNLHDEYWKEFFEHMDKNQKFPPMYEEGTTDVFVHYNNVVAIAIKLT